MLVVVLGIRVEARRRMAEGTTLLSASNDKTLVEWDLSTIELKPLIDAGCEQVQDYLQTNPNVHEDDKRFCQ